MLSVFQEASCPPCPSPFNLAHYVLEAGLSCPDKTALVVASRTKVDQWSYKDLRAAILGTATGLLETGLTSGDKILMRLGNTVDFPITFLGAIAAGLVPVPTSAQLTSDEVRRMCAPLDIRTVVHDASVPCPEDFGSTVDLARLRSWRSRAPAEFDFGAPDRLAYIIFTSGTSGNARAVCHAHRAIWARRMMVSDWYGLTALDRVCHAGAFNWTFTLGSGLMDPWTAGATAVIPESSVALTDFPQLMSKHEATIFAGAPGVYRSLLKSQNLSLPNLRHGISAGEKLPDSIRTAWKKATGTEIYEAFGMSECSTFISSSPTRPSRGGALGYPQRGRKIAILGDTGPLERGECGMIAVAQDDPGLMLRYENAPDETAARFQDGWFLTGDLGQMDDDGLIHYLGRSDDLMNAGGFRVSPAEVERALADMPGVTEVAVTAVEIKANVDVIAAFFTSDTNIESEAFAAHAAGKLARYKQPRLFVQLDALPRNPNGKVLRKALRAMVPQAK